MNEKDQNETLKKHANIKENRNITANKDTSNELAVDSAILDQYNKTITHLPGMLTTVDSFTNKNGFTVGDIDVKMPDDSILSLKEVPISGYTETTIKPNPLSVFNVTWDMPAGRLENVTLHEILLNQKVNNVRATYVGALEEFKTEVKAKQTMTNGDDAIKNILKKSGNMNSEEEKKLDDCIKLSPKSMKEALEKMAKTDDKTKVYGNRQDETAIIIKDGKILFSTTPNSAPVPEQAAKVDAKGLVATNVKTHGTRIKTSQEASGLDSSRMPGEDFMPAGTIFTPRLNRIPGMDIIETLITLADATKLVYDFFDAYNQGQQ